MSDHSPFHSDSIQNILLKRLNDSNIDAVDLNLANAIAVAFADLADHWPNGVFEIRADQLLFAYYVAAEGIASVSGKASALALGMGCGEGKQEGYAIGIRVAWQQLIKAGFTHPKFLFVSSSPELLQQMLTSPAFIGASLPLHPYMPTRKQAFHTPKAAKGSEAGLHLLDIKTLLRFLLDIRTGHQHALLHDVDKLFCDEAQVFLQHNPFIRSQGSNLLHQLMQENHAAGRRALNELAVLESLNQTVSSLIRQHPESVLHCRDRHQREFDTKAFFPLDALYQRIEQIHPDALCRIAPHKTDLQRLCNKIATASSLHAGRDYYLHYKTGAEKHASITGYCIADQATGAPMPGTVFHDRELACFIALRHVQAATTRSQCEQRFLSDTWLSKTLAEARPQHLLDFLQPQRFLLASATLEPVASMLKANGFTRLALQQESKLDVCDERVHIGLTEHVAHQHVWQRILAALPGVNAEHYTNSNPVSALPSQIAITSRDAVQLKALADALHQPLPSDADAASCKLADYMVIPLFHAAGNPDPNAFRQQVAQLKAAIQSNPDQPRLILMQGLGEGSNLFGCSAHGEYEAAIIKLDLTTLDRLTHTRYRLGARGRADGQFVQQVHRADLHREALTAIEIQELKQAKSKTVQQRLMLAIQQQMQQEQGTALPVATVVQAQGLASPDHGVVVARRDFMKRSVKTAMAMACASIVPSFMFSQTAFANRVELPPGVSNCKDNALIQAYFLWHLNEQNTIGGSDRQNAIQIMGFDSRGYGGTMSLNPKSKFREPLYQLIVNEMQKENWVNFKELKKKNLPLAYFSGGIQDYFITFVHQNWWRYNMTRQDGIDEATNYFAKSFVTAAGFPESDYKTLLNKINSKTEDEFIINLTKSLKKQSYYNKLTAAWSGYYLTSIFEITQGGNPMQEIINKSIKTKSGFIGKNLEMVATGYIGFWIRGPPGRI